MSSSFFEKAQAFAQLNLCLFRSEIPIELRHRILDFGLHDPKDPTFKTNFEIFKKGSFSSIPLPVPRFKHNNIWYTNQHAVFIAAFDRDISDSIHDNNEEFGIHWWPEQVETQQREVRCGEVWIDKYNKRFAQFCTKSKQLFIGSKFVFQKSNNYAVEIDEFRKLVKCLQDNIVYDYIQIVHYSVTLKVTGMLSFFC